MDEPGPAARGSTAAPHPRSRARPRPSLASSLATPHPPDVPEPRPRPSRLRRVWRYTWRITAALFVALVIALIACSFDDELLDTSALRHEPRQIPDSENAYLVLAKAAERLGEIEPFEWSRWSELIAGLDWDEIEVSECLHDRDYAIDAVRQLRAFHSAQAPIPHDAESAYMPLPRIDLPMRLTLLNARRLQRAKDHAAASNSCGTASTRSA